MNDDLDTGIEPTAPVWAVFGDLMSVLLGAFVLVLVGVIGMQLELSAQKLLVFRNEGHGGGNVVYRREDGNIGWIDPRNSK